MIRDKHEMTEHEMLKHKAMIAIDDLKRCIANGDGKDVVTSVKALLKKHKR